MMTTYSPKKGEVERNWFVVDASELPLGRVCTEVAKILIGKHKPQYAPHVDTGDFVVVVNAEKAVLSGQKEEAKIYYRSTTRPGASRSR
jgi:large subunit ribosomal protein L13